MSAFFYSPSRSHNPYRFFLKLENKHVVSSPSGHSFLMGGVALATAMEAIEKVTQKPVLWATAQYLSFVQANSILDIDVDVRIQGNTASQAKALCHVGEKEIITVDAALGFKENQPSLQSVSMPDFVPPEKCQTMVEKDRDADDFNRNYEKRGLWDEEKSQFNRIRYWTRIACGEEVSSGHLAIIGDYLLGAVHYLLGEGVNTNSLDNTIRIAKIVQTDWILCDVIIPYIGNGFCMGEMRMFAQDGTLLAVASQSGIVRTPRKAES